MSSDFSASRGVCLNVMVNLMKYELSLLVFNRIGNVRRPKHFWRVYVTMATISRLVMLVTIVTLGILVTLVTTITGKLKVVLITTEKKRNFRSEGKSDNISNQIN